MKFEIIADDYYKIFINEILIKNIDFKKERDLENFLKGIILNIKSRYNIVLKGLYDVSISINESIGALIELEKIETFFSKNKDVDLRIKVIFECDFYFKTKDYYVLKDYSDIYYYNNNYYIDALELNDFIKYIEFGDLIEKRLYDVEEIGIKIGKN